MHAETSASHAVGKGPGAHPQAFVILCGTLLPPSAFIVREYLGTPCVVLLFVLGPLAVAAALYMSGRWRPSENAARALTLVTLVLLVAIFLLDYARENVHHGGLGKDRDDALEQATSALLHGEYPYRGTTYLGGQITPMPGALVLSAPFALLGGTVYGNLFWLGVFSLLLARLSSWRHACLLLAVTSFSPGVLQGLLHGDDFIANATAVLLGVLLAIELNGARRLAALAFLGCALSWRFTFVFLLPPIVATLYWRGGRRAAAFAAAVPVLSFAAVTLPFALYDPLAFAPLHIVSAVASRPGGMTLTPLLAIGLAVASMRWMDGTTASALRAAWLVLWVPAMGAALSAAVAGHGWSWLEYPGLATFFAVASVASALGAPSPAYSATR